MYHFGTKTPLTGGLKNTCASMPNEAQVIGQRGTPCFYTTNGVRYSIELHSLKMTIWNRFFLTTLQSSDPSYNPSRKSLRCSHRRRA